MNIGEKMDQSGWAAHMSNIKQRTSKLAVCNDLSSVV